MLIHKKQTRDESLLHYAAFLKIVCHRKVALVLPCIIGLNQTSKALSNNA